MEVEAMDEALGMPEIVAKIQSFLDNKTFLKSRLLSKGWNEEALTAYPRRRKGLSLNVGAYMDQTYSRTPTLLQIGSPLATRVFAGGDPGKHEGEGLDKDPKDFLLFFKFGGGEKTEVITFDNYATQNSHLSMSWGGALYEVLKRGLAPALKKLVVTFDIKGRVNEAFEKGDQDLSECLGGLKELELRCHWSWDSFGVEEGPFTPFIRALIRGAGNLEKLRIRGPFFPHPADTEGLRSLKVLDLHLDSPSFIPQIDGLLSQVSVHCPLLEDLHCRLVYFLKKDPDMDGVTFPRLPNLKTLTCWSALGFPCGDVVRVLKEKMPLLESFRACPEIQYEPMGGYESFAYSLNGWTEKHEGLQFLSLPAPENPRLLEDLQTRFPSLKGLEVDAGDRPWFMKYKVAEDWVVALATVLKDFPFPSTISLHKEVDCEKAKEMFLASEGPEYKGTFLLVPTLARSYYKEIRLLPSAGPKDSSASS